MPWAGKSSRRLGPRGEILKVLRQFGLIPEFIGRFPVLAPLEPLDEAALIRILTEPKNALVRQYQKLFAYENVSLEFTVEALKRIAQKAIERDTGARGLRGILEQVLRKPMFEIPSLPGVKRCIIDEDVIDGAAEVKTTPVDLQTLAEASAAESGEQPLQMSASGGEGRGQWLVARKSIHPLTTMPLS